MGDIVRVERVETVNHFDLRAADGKQMRIGLDEVKREICALNASLRSVGNGLWERCGEESSYPRIGCAFQRHTFAVQN